MNISINKLPTLKMILEVEERKVQYTILKDQIDKLAHVHTVLGVAKQYANQCDGVEDMVECAQDSLAGVYQNMVNIYKELEEAVESEDEDQE